MRARQLAAFFFWAGATVASATEPTAVLGAAPKVEPGELSRVPNADAIVSRIWMPALDAGFVPQGLTVAGNLVLVAAYKSTSYQRSSIGTYADCRRQTPLPLAGEAGWGAASAPAGAAGEARQGRP